MANRVCVVADAKDASFHGLQVAYSSKIPATRTIKPARFFGTTPQQLCQELGLVRQPMPERTDLLSKIYTAALNILAKRAGIQLESLCAAAVSRLDSLESPILRAVAPCPLECGLKSTRYLKFGSPGPDETIVTFQVDRNDWFLQLLNMDIPHGRIVSISSAAMHHDSKDRWAWAQGLGVPFSVKGSVRLRQGSSNEWSRGCNEFSHQECKLLGITGDFLDIDELKLADSIWRRPRSITPTYAPLSIAWGVALEALYGMATACSTSGHWSINAGLTGALSAAHVLREQGCNVIGAGHGKVHVGITSPSKAPRMIVSDGIAWRRVGVDHQDTLLQKKIGERDYAAILSADQMVVAELKG